MGAIEYRSFDTFFLLIMSSSLTSIATMKQTSAMFLFHLVVITMNTGSSAFVTPTPKHQLWASSLTRSVVHPLPFVPRTTFLSLFDGLTGDKKTDDDELITFSNLPADQYDGLSEYVRQWAMLLESEEGGSGLTTPVKVVTSAEGAKILFKPKQIAYKSKDEERAAEEGTAEKKKEPKKQGGVEILVKKLDNEVEVRAKRCDMDEDTMIREMSEQTIVDGLKKAINVWKKDHAKK